MPCGSHSLQSSLPPCSLDRRTTYFYKIVRAFWWSDHHNCDKTYASKYMYCKPFLVGERRDTTTGVNALVFQNTMLIHHDRCRENKSALHTSTTDDGARFCFSAGNPHTASGHQARETINSSTRSLCVCYIVHKTKRKKRHVHTQTHAATGGTTQTYFVPGIRYATKKKLNYNVGVHIIKKRNFFRPY